MGKEVCVGVHEFYHNSCLLKDISSSFITIILKSKHPESLAEFRPISLINNIHKIISKQLAKRIKGVLSSVISPCQIAFLLGRQILDGVVVINEFIDWARRAKKIFFYL